MFKFFDLLKALKNFLFGQEITPVEKNLLLKKRYLQIGETIVNGKKLKHLIVTKKATRMQEIMKFLAKIGFARFRIS